MNPIQSPLTRARRAVRTATLVLSALALGIAALSPRARGDGPVVPEAAPATAPATRPPFKHPVADAAARFHSALATGDAAAAGRATAATARPMAD